MKPTIKKKKLNYSLYVNFIITCARPRQIRSTNPHASIYAISAIINGFSINSHILFRMCVRVFVVFFFKSFCLYVVRTLYVRI